MLKTYIENAELLKNLYAYGFSKERSELSSISVKLLAFIVHWQKKSSIKVTTLNLSQEIRIKSNILNINAISRCTFQREGSMLIVHVKSLVELLAYATKSPCCAINGLQLICELFTQNADRPAVVLQKIEPDTDDIDTLINLYESLHVAHVQVSHISQCSEATTNDDSFRVKKRIL